jgi:polyhydroxyalkanoate synthesis regulator phasin
MASNAMCGLGKLSKDNISDVLKLLDIDASQWSFNNKGAMVTFVYDTIVKNVKSVKKLKQKVEDLEREIENLQDIYIKFMEVLI